MTLLAATPALPVRDVLRGVAFHRDRLGFDPVHVGDGVAVLRRDEVEINPWEANNPHVPGAEPHLAGSASSRVRVNGVRALYDECRGQGIVHSNGALAIQPWGRADFTVLDADGNGIAFFEPATP